MIILENEHGTIVMDNEGTMTFINREKLVLDVARAIDQIADEANTTVQRAATMLGIMFGWKDTTGNKRFNAELFCRWYEGNYRDDRFTSPPEYRARKKKAE